jgi:lauroyl/myristoyl acyltransferase
MTRLLSLLPEGAADRAVAKATQALPLPVLDALGGSLGRYAGNRTRLPRRQDMQKVLPHLLPEKSTSEIEKLIDRNWSFIGQSLLRIGNLPRVVQKETIKASGLDRLEERKLAGQPSIIAFVHLGLWELAAVELATIDKMPLVIYQPPTNKARAAIAKKTRIDAYIGRLSNPEAADRPALEENLLSASPTAAAVMLRGLKNGGIGWFAVDECVGGHVHGPWFGKDWRRAGNMELVARFAHKTGAAIFPTWCLRTSNGYEITYSDPIFPHSGQSRDQLSDAIAERLRPQVEAHYEQWFMLHELRPGDFGLTP